MCLASLCKSKNRNAFSISEEANRPFEMLHIGPINRRVSTKEDFPLFFPFFPPFALKQLCDVSQAIPFANFSWPHSSCTKDLCSLWPLSVSFCELSRQVSLHWNACSQGEDVKKRDGKNAHNGTYRHKICFPTYICNMYVTRKKAKMGQYAFLPEGGQYISPNWDMWP